MAINPGVCRLVLAYREFPGLSVIVQPMGSSVVNSLKTSYKSLYITVMMAVMYRPKRGHSFQLCAYYPASNCQRYVTLGSLFVSQLFYGRSLSPYLTMILLLTTRAMQSRPLSSPLPPFVYGQIKISSEPTVMRRRLGTGFRAIGRRSNVRSSCMGVPLRYY